MTAGITRYPDVLNVGQVLYNQDLETGNGAVVEITQHGWGNSELALILLPL
jgi:hypothetical protein